MILDPGFSLTLRPMKYPELYKHYKQGLKDHWNVEEVDFSGDMKDLHSNLSDAEHHLIKRLVAFFATGDSIVSNNLVLNLYKHINSPEARVYLSLQLEQEARHVDFYLTLLDTYIPEHREREQAFSAVDNIPSIRKKANFCLKYIDSIHELSRLETDADKRRFLLNLICFACCIEGLFFFGAFAYVYYLRSRNLLHGLAAGTDWVFRDESAGHMEFAFKVIDIVRNEQPELFDDSLKQDVMQMLEEAIDCEHQFALDALGEGITGMKPADMREYLQYIADSRLERLGYERVYGSKNPFSFMLLQDVQGLSNFFEKRVSAYQMAVTGDVSFEEEF